jgi:hypothetical protein
MGGRLNTGPLTERTAPVIPAPVLSSSLPVTLDGYKLSGLDSDADPYYFGHVDPDGNWYIMKLDVAAGTSLYVKGASGYPAAWAGRTGLGYDYFNAVF